MCLKILGFFRDGIILAGTQFTQLNEKRRRFFFFVWAPFFSTIQVLQVLAIPSGKLT